MKKNVAILATGGMDSTVLLYRAASDPDIGNLTALTVDYGHVVFARQMELLRYHVEKLSTARPIGLEPLKIIFDEWQRRPGLFTVGYSPTEDSPLEAWDQRRYTDFFVEGRNAAMILKALAYCSVKGFDELWAGYLYTEKEWQSRHTVKLLTGDNSPQFVDAMNILAQLGFSRAVRFRAPWYEQKLDKAEVAALGIRLGIDFSKTYSCYFDPPCGKCDNCLLRRGILGENG